MPKSPARYPTCHVFVGSKAPWFEITDDLPQYSEQYAPQSRKNPRQAMAHARRA
jgi:hypothetical protein